MKGTYRLYIWHYCHSAGCICGRGHYVRGRCIGEYRLYKELVADAQRRAVAAGYPKSRWMDLFDWNV